MLRDPAINPGRVRKIFSRTVFGALVLLLGVYGFSFRASIQRVDAFCASVDEKANVADLPALAKKIGVRLHGPREGHDETGRYFYALVASPFALGEYACLVRGDSEGRVVSKRLGDD